MIRINLYITKEQVEGLKILAKTGVRISEHIRRALDEYLRKNLSKTEGKDGN